MAELRVKSDVLPPSLLLLAGVANVAQRISSVPTITITAGRNGVHKVNSRHYVDAALDIRTKNLPTRAAKLAFVEALRRKFPRPRYDVLFEGEGTPNEHIHLERNADPLELA